MPTEISFNNMVEKLLESVPELKQIHDRELRSWEGEWPGQHIAYARVVSDTIAAMLRGDSEEDPNLLIKIFNFLEILANHPDEHVQEVVHNSVCEDICSDELVLQKAGRFMGVTTKKFCRDIIGNSKPPDRF